MSFIAACIQKCTDCNQKKETELEGDNEVVQNPAHMVQEKAPPANPNEAAETAVAPNLEEEVRAKATGVCIEGYLMRQSREGKWKKRFYETVEENGWWMLVYYKTPEREKILNAVKLHRTSQIAISDKDAHGAGVFGIEMESSQVYLHKAASEADAEKWVAALVQCRAAAIQQKAAARVARRASLSIDSFGSNGGEDMDSPSISSMSFQPNATPAPGITLTSGRAPKQAAATVGTAEATATPSSAPARPPAGPMQSVNLDDDAKSEAGKNGGEGGGGGGGDGDQPAAAGVL
mmetsp:Transcript_31690/g.73260  ORF Transcript_31690/g.73260 Transcript_31690/m.73260 type:complete len:291 (-) Transcript_31690:354-1226(-)